MKAFRRLGFDNNLLIDDEVNHLSRKWFALVVHHHGDFAIHAMPSGNELPLEGAKVNQLAVAEAERAVHLVKRGDDGARCLFFKESAHDATVAYVGLDRSIILWRGVSFYFRAELDSSPGVKPEDPTLSMKAVPLASVPFR